MTHLLPPSRTVTSLAYPSSLLRYFLGLSGELLSGFGVFSLLFTGGFILLIRQSLARLLW